MNIYRDEQCEQVASKIINSYREQNQRIVEVTFDKIDCECDSVFRWQVTEITDIVKQCNIVVYCIPCYNTHKLYFLLEGDSMKSYLTVAIPYGTRSRYVDAVYEVNDLIDNNGMLLLAVNNNPYAFSSYLLIETNENTDMIKQILDKNGLALDFTKGLEEIILEQSHKKWDTVNFLKHEDKEMFRLQFNSMFFFAEQAELEGKMPSNTVDVKRPKVFISYSHKDAVAVNKIVLAMTDSGVDAWFDKTALDYGDDIIERVHSAMKECDLAVVFLSHHTKDSLFAKHELKTLYSQIIYSTGNWFPIKLDDVNVNEIVEGLQNYLYYDFYVNGEISSLVQDLKKKIKSLK